MQQDLSLQMTYANYDQAFDQSTNVVSQSLNPAFREIQNRNTFAMAVNHTHLTSVGMTFTADPVSFMRDAKRARTGTEPGVQQILSTPNFQPSMVRALDLGGQAAERILATAKGRYGQMMQHQHAIQSSLAASPQAHDLKVAHTSFVPSAGPYFSSPAAYPSPTSLGYHMPGFSPTIGTPLGHIPTSGSIANPMTPVHAVAPSELMIPNTGAFAPGSTPHLMQPILDAQRQKELLQQPDIPAVASRKRRKRHSRTAAAAAAAAREEEKVARSSPGTPSQVRMTVSKQTYSKDTTLENDVKVLRINEDTPQSTDMDFAMMMTQAPSLEKQEKTDQEIPVTSTQPAQATMSTNTWPSDVFGDATLTLGRDSTSSFLNSHEMQQDLAGNAFQLALHNRQENDGDSTMFHSSDRHRSHSITSNGQSAMAEALKQQQPSNPRSRSSSTTSVPVMAVDGKD
ncbi:hypothetical protein BGZ73_004709, partial [Actinomortierella ambigua]